MAHLNRVSNEQLERLLDHLVDHTTMATGVGLGSRSKETVDRQWKELAKRLNACGSGSSKTGERWKKYWIDLKHKVKTRLSKRRQEALGTGGGPSTQPELTETEKKVLAIIGEQAVYGDSQHRVPIFDYQPIEVSGLPAGPSNNIMAPEEFIETDIFDLPPVTNEGENEGEGQMETSVQEPQPHQIDPDISTGRNYHRRNHSGLISNSTTRTRVEPEWVIEIERSRVQAEMKMAEANLKMAEASKMSAEAYLKMAEASKMSAEANLKMAGAFNKISEASLITAETSRRHVEVMERVVDVINELTNVLVARKSPILK